ncbi:MAG: DUF1036 domain-containing protein [Pseudorhodoplanes sp.]|uniref:DUF1036 domain-containing protein n=1 Tax=Pseudorhodoplanes sp. TaxID=1934341 RepID=UPI003D0F483B
MIALAVTPARADLKLCNNLSYVVDVALAFEDRGTATSRGWYRLEPGQCRNALQGKLPAGELFLHARVLPMYGGAPLPLRGDTEFCTGSTDFSIASARNCRGGQRPVLFTAAKPSQTEEGHRVTLAEEAGYSEDQARDAGIQRLLAVAGYDPGPIDGVRGDKTDNAIRQFAQDSKLQVTAAARSDFFTLLMEAAQKPGTGFAWCNDTAYAVMAAIGIEDANAITTRGWYRVEPGRCLRPEAAGQAKRIFSFGEAVDANGQTLSSGGRPIAWGGATMLCTRAAKFESYDHVDCKARGMAQTGFAAVETGQGPTIVRFK